MAAVVGVCRLTPSPRLTGDGLKEEVAAVADREALPQAFDVAAQSTSRSSFEERSTDDPERSSWSSLQPQSNHTTLGTTGRHHSACTKQTLIHLSPPYTCHIQHNSTQHAAGKLARGTSNKILKY